MASQRLLIIEDDYDVAELLLMYFRAQNYDVYHADSGQAGVDLARIKFPNLILLDIMLPDMDGYDVCVKLRSTALTKYIPILFLTQKDERASKVYGLELGVDDYITKPFDIDELRLRVQGAIKRATRENLNESRTGLPTDEILLDVIQQKRQSRENFVAMGYKIQGFDAYHDVYGFVAANDVLNYAGSIIQQSIAKHGTTQDFVGITHDDEFVIFTHSSNIKVLDEAIKTRFATEARAFYSFIDVDKGYVILDAGTSYERKVPLMTLKSQQKNLSKASA